MSSSKILHVILVAVGGGLVLLAVLSAIQTAEVLWNSEPADGVVVEMVRSESKGRSGGVHYWPRVQVTDAAGNKIIFTDAVGEGTSDAFELGEQVPVRFYPDAPHLSRIDSLGRLFFAPLVLAPGGLVLLGIAWLVRLFS